MRVVVVGAGWAGCAAACSAAKMGASVVLLERTDSVLGSGQVGGIMRNNGRNTVAEELIAMGGGALLELADTHAKHNDLSFLHHAHALCYDATTLPQAVENFLRQQGIDLILQQRVTDLERQGDRITAVITQTGERYAADCFVDATGTAGPMASCRKHGNGCAMCVYRCPAFGGRVSLGAMAGLAELACTRPSGEHGVFSGACALAMDSLSEALQQKLQSEGVVQIPIPKALQERHESEKACRQYGTAAFGENLVLLDTGHAKMMTPYFPLHKLRKLAGLEQVRFLDPYAGGIGNSVRFTAVTPCGVTMQTKGLSNLFCAGERAGLLVGHTEGVITGTLAGYNAVRLCEGKPQFTFPVQTAIGKGISYVFAQIETEQGRSKTYSFSGTDLWEQMQKDGQDAETPTQIRRRIQDLRLTDVFCRK